MNDLSSLMQIAPITGAGFAGINQGQDEQMNELKQKELADLIMQRQQEAQQKAQMNPLMLAHQGLVNQGLQAGLPGITADSSLKQTTAAKSAGTLATDIEAGNTKNKVQMYTEVGQHLGSLSGAIEDNPGVAPHLVLAQQLDKLGVSDNQKQMLLQRYGNVPASQLASKLKADSARILRETPAYAQAMDVEASQGANRLAVARQQGANSLDVENARIAAGKYNKKNTELDVNQALLKYGHTAAATAEIYDRAAQIATAGGDDQEAARYTQLAQRARLRAAEDAQNRGVAQPRVDTGAVGGVPMVAPPAANAPVGSPGAAAPASAVPPALKGAKSIADVQRLDPRYAQIPPEKLRAILKQKFGVDLQ